tara:strand:- start:18119 stop:19231 length:1113 start_codon:yes stop_codon:yes gene_type:complete
MKKSITDSTNNFEEDQIDFISVLKKIWFARKLIISVTISFFFIGILVALSSPVLYTSETTFVPQVSDDQSSSSNNLGSLASLAGINIRPTEMKTDSYLSPLVYNNIIDSEEFSLKLLSAGLINLNNDKFTIKEYLLSRKSLFSFNLNPIGFIKKYTIDLLLNEEPSDVNSDIVKNYNFISDEDYNLIKSFREKFKIDIQEKKGYIKVLASDKNPFISSQLVEKITKSLQSKIIEIRTNKIRERLEFSKEQYELKQIEFDILQKKLAEFKDSNKIISTARFRSELQKLESEYNLQQNILVNLATEYNNNKIKLNKDTPIFSVIDEVSIPNVRTQPKRSIIVTKYVLLGFILSIIFILSKDTVLSLVKEIKN